MGEKMSGSERRRYLRKDALNLLDYSVPGQNGELVDRGMGRTINISEKGILFETHVSFQVGQIIMITIELEEDLVEIEGCIKHVEPCLEKFNSGVEFLHMNAEGERVLKNYLAAFKKAGF
jgi:c-di-GMP-binding flagellar brake protein YcgR